MPVYNQLLTAVTKTQNTFQKKSTILNTYLIVKKLNLEIASKTYTPSQFTCFVVLDPTPREIFAPAFSDRIIHRFLIDDIESYIDKKFIYASFANRKHKGTHNAVRYLQTILQKKSSKYYLQIDVKSFFASIDKNILFEKIKHHLYNLPISNQELDLYLYLCKKIIFHNFINPSPIFTGDKKLLKLIPKHKSMFYNDTDKGLPIGSLSSQFFANIYLNELDQFTKHELKIKYYIRYVDDIIIIGETPEELLNYKLRIELFLQKKLKLKLHPTKIILKTTSSGIDFLGYITRKNYILVRNRTVKSFKKKLYLFNKQLDPMASKNFTQQKLDFNKKFDIANIHTTVPNLQSLQLILATINSYYGIFCFADTYGLRKNLYHKHFKFLKKYFEPSDSEYKSIKIREEYISNEHT